MMDVLSPKWGLTMEDAEVGDWLCVVGASVAEGEEILELETDKATGAVEAPCAGVIVEQLVTKGEVVEPGQVVARIEPA